MSSKEKFVITISRQFGINGAIDFLKNSIE